MGKPLVARDAKRTPTDKPNECVDRFEEAFGDKRQNPARRMLAFEDIGDVEVESVKYATATPSSRGFDIFD